MPSISLEGQKLAFSAPSRGSSLTRRSKLEVRVRDLFTGREIVVAVSERRALNDRALMHPTISRDGTLVAYNANQALDIYAARVSNPPSSDMLVREAKGLVWDWSRDNKRLLFSNGRDEAIHEVNVSSGAQSIFLSKTGYELYQSKFSPDGRGLGLIGCDSHRPGMQCRVFVVPLNHDGVPQTDHSIVIDHPSLWDDKPRWSPSGNLLYFVSDRDGHLCLWAQRLEVKTKQPIGTPFPLYHFHNSRLAMINVGTGSLEIDVARDKIVMGLGELTGNIWTLKR
jgi:eukaryotic-like serine/threonine-protein kinase